MRPNHSRVSKGEDAVVLAFSHVARSIMLQFLPRRSCIASSRITVEVLRSFGVRSTPVPVSLHLHIPAMQLMYFTGVPAETRDEYRKKAANYVEMEPFLNGNWNGHLVVETATTLLDPTFDQAFHAFKQAGHAIDDRPHIGVFPSQGLMQTGTKTLEIQAYLENDVRFTVQYAPLDDGSFASAPAWELDELQIPIALIRAKMLEALPNDGPV